MKQCTHNCTLHEFFTWTFADVVIVILISNWSEVVVLRKIKDGLSTASGVIQTHDDDDFAKLIYLIGYGDEHKWRPERACAKPNIPWSALLLAWPAMSSPACITEMYCVRWSQVENRESPKVYRTCSCFGETLENLMVVVTLVCSLPKVHHHIRVHSSPEVWGWFWFW